MKAKSRNEKTRMWKARKRRVQKRVARSSRTAVTVYRSNKHIYAILVDGKTGRTLGGVSTRSPEIASAVSSTGNIEAARKVGAALAAIARERNIERAVFNRNGFLYHGRVKALAEAAREAGLEF